MFFSSCYTFYWNSILSISSFPPVWLAFPFWDFLIGYPKYDYILQIYDWLLSSFRGDSFCGPKKMILLSLNQTNYTVRLSRVKSLWSEDVLFDLFTDKRLFCSNRDNSCKLRIDVFGGLEMWLNNFMWFWEIERSESLFPYR